MLASYRGHVEVVELLLEYGSDVNLTTQVDNWILGIHYTFYRPCNHMNSSHIPIIKCVHIQCTCHKKVGLCVHTHAHN